MNFRFSLDHSRTNTKNSCDRFYKMAVVESTLIKLRLILVYIIKSLLSILNTYVFMINMYTMGKSKWFH